MSSIRLLSARAIVLLLACIPCIAAAVEPDSRLLSPAGEQALTPPPELAAEDQLIPEGQPYAENHLGERIAVRPLDDPANPYYGQYGEWDRWLLAQWHSDQVMPDFSSQIYGAAPLAYAFWVDNNGWLVPQLIGDSFASGHLPKGAESLAEWVGRDWTKTSEESKKVFSLWVYSALPDQHYKSLEQSKALVLARQMPLIPSWLGEQPPLASVFMENGEICCYGELGQRFLADDPQRRFMLPAGLSWYRYSKEGELLGRHDHCGSWPDHEWLNLYFPRFGDFCRQHQSEGHGFGYYGPYFVTTRPTEETLILYGRDPVRGRREVVTAHRYDGQPVDAASVNYEFNNYYRALRPLELEQAYAGQVAAGMNSADSASPFAGMPNGPQVSDKPMQEQQMPKLANRGMSFERNILVTELDNPGNPFGGTYSHWDTWLHNAIGQTSPSLEAAFEAQQAEFNRRMSEARKSGDENPDIDYIFAPIIEDPADDWRIAEAVFTPAGHMIPIADSAWRDFSTRRFLSWSSTSFTDTDWFGAHGSGELSDEDYAAFNNYRWQCAAARVPQIPDWLASQPVMKAVLLANGEVVTMGPLGSWSDSDEGSEELAGSSFEARWFRYSPQGELLGSAERGAEWAQFYCAGLSALSAEAAASDMQLYCIGEHIYLRPMNENTPRAFNWAGEEVSFSPALFGEMLYGEELSWRTLRNVLKVRRGESVAIPPLH